MPRVSGPYNQTVPPQQPKGKNRTFASQIEIHVAVLFCFGNRCPDLSLNHDVTQDRLKIYSDPAASASSVLRSKMYTTMTACFVFNNSTAGKGRGMATPIQSWGYNCLLALGLQVSPHQAKIHCKQFPPALFTQKPLLEVFSLFLNKSTLALLKIKIQFELE